MLPAQFFPSNLGPLSQCGLIRVQPPDPAGVLGSTLPKLLYTRHLATPALRGQSCGQCWVTWVSHNPDSQFLLTENPVHAAKSQIAQWPKQQPQDLIPVVTVHKNQKFTLELISKWPSSFSVCACVHMYKWPGNFWIMLVGYTFDKCIQKLTLKIYMAGAERWLKS